MITMTLPGKRHILPYKHLTWTHVSRGEFKTVSLQDTLHGHMTTARQPFRRCSSLLASIHSSSHDMNSAIFT